MAVMRSYWTKSNWHFARGCTQMRLLVAHPCCKMDFVHRPRTRQHVRVETWAAKRRLSMDDGATKTGEGSGSTRPTIPAAQYIRMSTDHQQYSTANQQDAIREFANRHGYDIV